ncbi:MAG: DUF3656 domain-containing protein [Clostridium sp.]
MKKIELLAPAGSFESLIAAVQSGADAVYLGGSKFSARAYASNFDEAEMSRAVEYCHGYGVKVYITINTLLKDKEIKEALEYAKFLYRIGVDALIVQDTGLVFLIKQCIPEFEIHASTQMSIHNGEGALFLKNLGFERIVLSRELNLEDINYISKDLGVETEVFVHGALCICYSGQCIMSSVIGGRSGNRGKCAQTCRLPYKLYGKKTKVEKDGYIMSPKDICTIENIKELIESGTSSLKIEGRMKRPEYVAGVVSIYRKSIDSYYNNTLFNLEEEKRTLTQLFNREGFSKAYLLGNVGRDMMAYKTPKNTGVFLGKANHDGTILLKEPIVVKDGVRIDDTGFTVSRILIKKKEVDRANIGDIVKLIPSEYKSGDMLYRAADNELLLELAKSYKNSYERKIGLSGKFTFKIDEAMKLEVEFNGKEFIAKGEIVQAALKKPLEKDKIEKNIYKAGETALKIEKIEFVHFDEGFVPVASINEIRRTIIEKIEEYTEKSNKRSLNDIASEGVNYAPVNQSMPELIVTLQREEQLRAVEELGIKDVAINIFNMRGNVDLGNLNIDNIYLKVPNVIRDKEFKAVASEIEKNLHRIKGIITGNMGIINKFSGKTIIYGDYKMNSLNSFSHKFYTEIINGVYLSAELNRAELINIGKKSPANSCGVIIYGRYELMVSEYCPIGSIYGGKSKENKCSGACTLDDYVLIDRKGEEFIIDVDRACRSYIYNNVPVNLFPYTNELRKNNIKSFRIDFINEGYEQCKRILSGFINNSFNEEVENYTRGHYKRGIE